MQYLLELKLGYDKIAPLIQLPSPDEDGDSLLDRFFQLTINGEVSTDEEAASLLYGPGKDGSHPPYQKLKAKLKVYLPFRLCQLPLKEQGGTPTVIFGARMYLLWAGECKIRQKFKAAEWLLMKALRMGESVEQFRVIQEALQELCALYSGPLYDVAKFRTYRKLLAKNRQLKEAVDRLHLNYYKVQGLTIRKGRRLVDNSSLFQSIYDEVREVINSYHCSKVVYYGYSTLDLISRFRGDFANAKTVEEEAISRAATLSYMKNGIISTKLSSLAVTLTKLKDYEGCIRVIEQREQLGLSQSKSPYVYMFYRIISLLALKKYATAAEVSNKIVIREVQKMHSDESALSFQFIFAYLYVLAEIGLINRSVLPKKAAEFRLSRFMNEVQLFEKNKQGYNVHIRIIELFHLVIHKRFDRFIDRVESMEKYVQRYLSHPDHLRNGLFLKLLASAARYNFNAEALEKGEEESIERMRSIENTAFMIDPASTEFIPYEDQWQLFLLALRGV